MNKLPKSVKTLSIKKLENAHSSGSECVYIPCGNNYGMKVYWNKKTRDFGFKHQKILSEYELTPRVGRKFERIIDKEKVYGYITESAKVTYDYKLNSKLHYLAKKLKNKGYIWYDDSVYNVGIIRGKLVLIDTNPLSFRK